MDRHGVEVENCGIFPTKAFVDVLEVGEKIICLYFGC